jgi:hypothetical protein
MTSKVSWTSSHVEMKSSPSPFKLPKEEKKGIKHTWESPGTVGNITKL